MTDKVTVNDIRLAGSLMMIGVPYITFEDGSDPFIKIQTKQGTSFNFFFEPFHDGKRTQDYVDAWFDDDYIANNQECLFAAAKAAFINYNYLLDVVKQAKPLIMLVKGRSQAWMQGLNEEQTKEVLKKMR